MADEKTVQFMNPNKTEEAGPPIISFWQIPGAMEMAKKGLEIAEAYIAKEHVNRTHVLWSKVLIFALLIGAAVYLNVIGKFDPTISFFFGSLVGFFFGKDKLEH